MATIFAPQVRTIQPAFEYSTTSGGEVKIYFSLSSYNTIEDVNSVTVTITNPRLSAGASGYTINTSTISKDWPSDENTGEYCVSITLPKETLNYEQYYQAQLVLNGSTSSEASQITLLKAVPTGRTTTVNIDTKTRTIYGELKYSTPSTETIRSYSIELVEDGVSVYQSKEIDNNSYGLSYSTVINYYFKEGPTYIAKVTYTTINGFVETIKSAATTVEQETVELWKNVTVLLSDDENGGGIHIEIKSGLDASGKLRIQRAEEESGFRAWETVTSITIKNAFKEGYTVSWKDYFVEGGKIYQYRIFFDASDNTTYLTSGYYYSPTFGDIFISTTERQLAVRYNPNITGYKWVTQESITNTLGGKYPLVRRNAQTKYRQFNLSGTIYIDPSDIVDSSTDSRGRSMSFWMDDNQSSLFLNHSELYNFKEDIKGIEQYIQDERIFEKRFREMAMQFLTDGQVKLFRSYQEGNIIVYLSNVSFTPNKQLDRRVYDFSATVTELCDATEQNMEKYRIYKPAIAYRYVLRIQDYEESTEIAFTPYISIEQLFNDNTFIVEYEEETGV